MIEIIGFDKVKQGHYEHVSYENLKVRVSNTQELEALRQHMQKEYSCSIYFTTRELREGQ